MTQPQSVFIKKDMQEFVTHIQSESSNATAFRKRKTPSKLSNQKYTQYSTEQEEEKVRLKKNSSLQKAIRSIDMKYTKRLSITSAIKRRSHITDTCQQNITNSINNKTHLNKVQTQEANIKQQPQSIINAHSQTYTFTKSEKDIFKNNPDLNDRHFQNWINQSIIENCIDQTFDKSIRNPGLRKYELDRNSLVSCGISTENISRILKSMYIYSIGFHNMLKDIGVKNKKIICNIWRVFSILLSHCSKGYVQTAISQIQSQLEEKIDRLKQEITEKESIIEQNQKNNREKIIEICNEAKMHKIQKELLQIDKNNLYADSKEHQKAYIEEISLRILFQGKIGDIHKLYRELCIKHEKLFHDFQIKFQQAQYFKDKNTNLTNQNVNLKKQLIQVKQHLKQMKMELQMRQTQYELVEKTLKDSYNEGAKAIMQKKIIENKLKDMEMNEIRIINKLKNTQASLRMIEQSRKSLQTQYFRSLEENKIIISEFQSEIGTISHRFDEQRDSNIENATFLSSIHQLQLKLQQKQQKIQENSIKIKELLLDITSKSQKLEQTQLQKQNLQQNLNVFLCSIQELKKVNNNLVSKLQQYETEVNSHTKLITTKQYQNNQNKLIIYELEDRIFNLQNGKSQLISKNKILEETIISNQKHFKAQIENIQAQSLQKVESYRKYKVSFFQLKSSNEKLKEVSQNLNEKLKNEKFQRQNLELRYKQSLSVVQSLSEVIKSLRVKISQLQEKNQIESLALKIKTSSLENQDKKYQAELKKTHERFLQIRAIAQKKADFVHPMILEDAVENYMRLQDKMHELECQLCDVKDYYKKMCKQLEESLLKSEDQRRNMWSQSQKQMKKLKFQLQYQREKSKQFADKIQELELKLSVLAKKQRSFVQSQNFREKQRRYLQVIKEERLRMQSLLKDVEIMQDQNNTLVIRIASTEKQLQQTTQKIALIQRQKQILQDEKMQLQEQNEELEQLHLKQMLTQKDHAIIRQNSSKISKKSRNGTSPKKQLKMRQQGNVKDGKNLFQAVDWRTDFKNKVKNTINYYNN